MKILIKGAGDLATGIASRLYHGGHTVLMTEIEVPLTVRRIVALSRAVYEETACVEDMTGTLVTSIKEAEAVIEKGDIPVIVDPKATIANGYKPDVIVDAILAKRNLGTKITDAPFVIGVGPGFTAGEDCHCVIETKRGHTLGKTIYEGSAIPNTGVPGDVGGFTMERLIRASSDGEMCPIVQIGDFVKKGDVVAKTGGKDVYAQMSGIVRGMLQPEVHVWEGLKIGDIDARCEASHCFTISDKARAIGGGVLEAVSGFERIYGKYASVVLAAGKSTRFGENKLLAIVGDRLLWEYTLKRMQAFSGIPQFLVTGYEEIARAGRKQGMYVIKNEEPDLGISHSIELGLDACLRANPKIKGVLFSVCDQPHLSVATIQKIWNTAIMHPGQIICPGSKERPGNPVLWDRAFFSELLQLTGDTGGRQIMLRMPEKIQYVKTKEEELRDIDKKEDMMCKDK